MTCKDCKNWSTCNSAAKSDKYEDGDSWAYWCDDFRSVHPTKWVRNGEYIVIQSGYNWHITIFHEPTERMVLHAAAQIKFTKRKLFDMVEFRKKLLEMGKEMLEMGKEIIGNGHGEDIEQH